VNQLMAFVSCVLASKAVLDVWFNGSIFSWHRAWAELLRDEGAWKVSRLLGELLTCRFCLSYHTSLWFTLCCIPILPWWALAPWWFAVRTAARFVDIFEEKLDGDSSTARGNDGVVSGDSETSLFD